MRRALRLSLIVMGIFLFSLVVSRVPAATPEALEAYKEAVEWVIGQDGEIEPEDRSALDAKKLNLGITDDEAVKIEEQIRQAVKRS